MRRLSVLFLLCASAVQAATPPSRDLDQISQEVDPAALRATITRLVAFGTRHTLSDTTSPERGIGAARRWAHGRFEAIAADCGGCLTIVSPGQTFTGERIPTPTAVEDVIAIQRGASDPDRVVIISGHIDSRNSDPLDSVHDAPGANDDGSGVAAVLEAARVLSKHRFPATVVYAVLSGEEQGLFGGKVLADYAKSQHWRVEANLNNDIVGNSHGQDGKVMDKDVRVFSEGVRVIETPAEAAQRRRTGGEMDSASRNLARFMRGMAIAHVPGFSVRMVLRSDRFSRGGDQLPMQEAGFPAVRVTETDENYDRQHQNVRVENGVSYGDVLTGVDFAYLANVTRVNVVSLAALAAAPAPPTDAALKGAVSPDTTIQWKASAGAADYRVWWRETTDPWWNPAQTRVTGGATTLTLKGINIDDYSFGVSAVAADGSESPVEFPGPAGAFFH